jgi:MFS family permease
VPRRFGLDQAGGDVALANLQANIVSTLQAGGFAGAVIAAPLSDKLGRRPALLISGAVALVGVILQFNAWGHVPVIYVGRLVHLLLVRGL